MQIPLLNGAFLIDNSGIELLRCPRLFLNVFLRRRVLASAKAGRNFGSTLHIGWATRYSLLGPKRVDPLTEGAIRSAMYGWLEANPQPIEDFRNYAHACNVMGVYNQHYQDEPFEVVANPSDGKMIVEKPFALPFGLVDGIPIIYIGKIDIGIRNTEGVWSFDHKSAFQFGRTFEAQMQQDGGQLGYTWALKNILGPDVKVNGYIIDAVRIRRPRKEDRYSDSGGPPVDASDLLRIPYHVSDDALAEWQDDTTELIRSIFHYCRTDKFPRHRWHCTNKYGTCDMYDVCSLPRGARENALYGNMYEPNTWSPLNKVTQDVAQATEPI